MKKIKKLLTVPLLLFCTYVYSQKEQINVLITVDDIITGSFNLSNGYIQIDNDTIELKYEIGRFNIEQKDFNRLQHEDVEKNVNLCFRYFSNCPTQKNSYYTLQVKLKLLFQNYLLIRVFNFESYPGVFGKKEEYGFEYDSPLETVRLPKNGKMKRNPCVK